MEITAEPPASFSPLPLPIVMAQVEAPAGRISVELELLSNSFNFPRKVQQMHWSKASPGKMQRQAGCIFDDAEKQWETFTAKTICRKLVRMRMAESEGWWSHRG